MAEYKDVDFELDEYGKMKEYTGANATVLAIRNIILSKKGNFPFTPDLGLNVEEYMFEQMDDITINHLKSELNRQINKYVPDINGVIVDVRRVESTDEEYPYETIGITVSAIDTNGENLSMAFLVKHDHENINVFAEVLK